MIYGMSYDDALAAGLVPVGMDRAYYESLQLTNPNAAGMIAAAQKPNEDWWDTAQRILIGIVQLDQQRTIMRLNIERAKLGQPPIDPTSYSGVGVQVGLAPSTQNLIVLGLLGLGAVLLLARR